MHVLVCKFVCVCVCFYTCSTRSLQPCSLASYFVGTWLKICRRTICGICVIFNVYFVYFVSNMWARDVTVHVSHERYSPPYQWVRSMLSFIKLKCSISNKSTYRFIRTKYGNVGLYCVHCKVYTHYTVQCTCIMYSQRGVFIIAVVIVIHLVFEQTI